MRALWNGFSRGQGGTEAKSSTRPPCVRKRRELDWTVSFSFHPSPFSLSLLTLTLTLSLSLSLSLRHHASGIRRPLISVPPCLREKTGARRTLVAAAAAPSGVNHDHRRRKAMSARRRSLRNRSRRSRLPHHPFRRLRPGFARTPSDGHEVRAVAAAAAPSGVDRNLRSRRAMSARRRSLRNDNRRSRLPHHPFRMLEHAGTRDVGPSEGAAWPRPLRTARGRASTHRSRASRPPRSPPSPYR